MTSAALGHHVFGVADRARGIQPFRARLCAVHDRMTAIEAERILQAVKPLPGGLIPTVGKPAIGLQQDRRTEILGLVPPIARARCGAAETEDSIPHAVEFGSFLGGLPALAIRRRLI